MATLANNCTCIWHQSMLDDDNYIPCDGFCNCEFNPIKCDGKYFRYRNQIPCFIIDKHGKKYYERLNLIFENYITSIIDEDAPHPSSIIDLEMEKGCHIKEFFEKQFDIKSSVIKFQNNIYYKIIQNRLSKYTLDQLFKYVPVQKSINQLIHICIEKNYFDYIEKLVEWYPDSLQFVNLYDLIKFVISEEDYPFDNSNIELYEFLASIFNINKLNEALSKVILINKINQKYNKNTEIIQKHIDFLLKQYNNIHIHDHKI